MKTKNNLYENIKTIGTKYTAMVILASALIGGYAKPAYSDSVDLPTINTSESNLENTIDKSAISEKNSNSDKWKLRGIYFLSTFLGLTIPVLISQDLRALREERSKMRRLRR